MSGVDHYAVLGVAPTATSDAVIAAFRRLAKQRHPDLGGTNERMAQLLEARRVLLDKERRREYDRARTESSSRKEPTPKPSPPPPPRPAQPDPLEARVRDVLRQYQQGDIAGAALAMDDLWGANRTSLLCGRARVVTALKHGSVLLDENDIEAATVWLEAASGTMQQFDQLRDEDALTGKASELRGRIAARRAARARQEAEAAAAAEAEATRLRLIEEEAARRQRAREVRRTLFVAVWALASALTYYAAYQDASSSLARASVAPSASNNALTPAARRERSRTAGHRSASAAEPVR